jgi:hypothetical protein
MPVWRCPHCGNPQPESSRCWVCHRLTTSCGTCRHFRRGIAGGLGLCGLDPRRTAIAAAEVRPCWSATAEAPQEAAPGRASLGPAREVAASAGRQTRVFVPVEELAARESPPAAISGAATRVGAVAGAPSPGEPPGAVAARGRWSLWAELEG